MVALREAVENAHLRNRPTHSIPIHEAIMTIARTNRSEDSTSEDRSIADELEHAAPELKSKAKDLLESGKEHLQGWKDNALDAVRDRPVRSMLIFVAVGALIGVLIGRRGN